MEFETGVQKKSKPKKTYDFSKVTPGSSVHVKDHAERVRVMSAFTYWAKNVRKIDAKATSEKVGEDDPKGPGYRVFFVPTRQQPATAALPVETKGDEI